MVFFLWVYVVGSDFDLVDWRFCVYVYFDFVEVCFLEIGVELFEGFVVGSEFVSWSDFFGLDFIELC